MVETESNIWIRSEADIEPVLEKTLKVHKKKHFEFIYVFRFRIRIVTDQESDPNLKPPENLDRITDYQSVAIEVYEKIDQYTHYFPSIADEFGLYTLGCYYPVLVHVRFSITIAEVIELIEYCLRIERLVVMI